MFVTHTTQGVGFSSPSSLPTPLSFLFPHVPFLSFFTIFEISTAHLILHSFVRARRSLFENSVQWKNTCVSCGSCHLNIKGGRVSFPFSFAVINMYRVLLSTLIFLLYLVNIILSPPPLVLQLHLPLFPLHSCSLFHKRGIYTNANR